MKLRFFLLALIPAFAAAVDLPLRINAGGLPIGDPNSEFHWVGSDAYAKKGIVFQFKGDHDISNVPFPGPKEIYQSVIHRDHSYQINNVPAGSYTIRFHISEGFESDKRAMDFKVNGKLVIDDLNVYRVAGGKNKAHIVEARIELNEMGPIVIECQKDQGNDVFVCGLEILPSAFKLTAPPNGWGGVQSLATVDAAAVQNFSGARTRVVWVQANQSQFYTNPSSKVFLMGMDTNDGGAERKILPEAGAYGKPLMTPGGGGVVFSDLVTEEIFVVDWSGGNKTKIANGYATDVWEDPKTTNSWVYYRKDGLNEKAPIYRKNLDGTGVEERVWAKTDNGHEGVPWFQLSGDGRKFVDAFPWNDCGVADLQTGKWGLYSGGCWPGIAPDDSYRTFIFNDHHVDITVHDDGGKNSRVVSISGMKGNNGRKVYFPRWTNQARYITVVAPEGSPVAELYLGKFNEDYTEIEGWVKITTNRKADMFGDAWIQPCEIPPPFSVTSSDVPVVAP